MQSAIARRVELHNPHQPSSLSDPSNPPKLKKLVNQVVQELATLGFSPEVVRDLVEQGNDALHAMRERRDSDERSTIVIQSHTVTGSGFKLLYEVDNDLGHLVPHLRVIVDKDVDVDTAVSEAHTAKTPALTREVKHYAPILTSLEDSLIDS